MIYSVEIECAVCPSDLIDLDYSNCLLFLIIGYRDADGLTALSIAAGKRNKPVTELLAGDLS